MGSGSIRISGGIRRIEVNDDGEYIVLNGNSTTLIPGFGRLKKSLEQKAALFQEKAEAIQSSGDLSEEDKLLKVLDLNHEIHKDITKDVDALFGEETCRKVFGKDIIPDSASFAEFFEAITPFLQEIEQEKVNRMSKYSPSRTGNT